MSAGDHGNLRHKFVRRDASTFEVDMLAQNFAENKQS